MELDATGLKQDINGVMMQVKGMIAGVAGGKDPNGGVYSAADILAQSGDSNEDIKNDLIDLYGPDADLTPVDDNGNLSRYVGKSMHDAQAVAQEGKDNIEAVYDQLYNDLENGPSGESDGSSSAPVRYVDHIKSAFEILADSLGKSSGEMTVSDVVGLSQDGVQLTDEQAQALDTLTAAADKYGTTIQGVAEAGEENGLFGGIENAQNGISAAAQQMETISQNIDNIQSAYKACTTAMEEYNKYGYMSADALQGLLSMNDEYLACLDVVDGKLQINNDRYADLIAAQYTEAEATAIEQAMHELEALQADDTKKKTEDLTTATEEQQTALENAVPAIQNATTATGQLAIALATANSAAEGDADMQAKIDTITNALNLCKDIFGKSKETAENTKDTANTSSETAENTKKATGITNLTINATQGTISEENKTEESAPEEKKQSKWDKFWGSKFWFWNWGKKASGDKKIKHGGTYNVDEAGPEMLVRQPASGRYTYLETGDGVVPADITSRLFEMGGNPDKWFSDQLAKNGSASMVQSRSSGGISLSIGDVNVNNPVGDSDALASELVNRLPNRIVQQLNKR